MSFKIKLSLKDVLPSQKSLVLLKAAHANLYSILKQSAKLRVLPIWIAFIVILRDAGDTFNNVSIVFSAHSELSSFNLHYNATLNKYF